MLLMLLWTAVAAAEPDLSGTWILAEEPTTLAQTHAAAVDEADVRWDETLSMGALAEDVDKSKVRLCFTLRDQDMLTAEYIGEATITLAELISKPSHTLLMQMKNGDPVLLMRKPPTPCELRVAVAPNSLPATWPRPAPAAGGRRPPPCHVPSAPSRFGR